MLALAVACAPPKVKLAALMSANKSPEVAKLSPIAVLPFDGPKSQQVTAHVEATIANIRIEDKPLFRLVDRAVISKVLSELRFSYSQLVDPKTACRVGQLVGAKGLIVGKVTKAICTDTPLRESRYKCTATDQKGRCISWYKYSVRCTKRQFHLEFAPKVINVETGRVLYADVLNAQSHISKMCSDGGSLQDKESALDEAMMSAMVRFRRNIAPYYVTLTVQLKKKDKNAPKYISELINDGVDWAKNGRLDRACEIWRNAYGKFPDSVALNYNIGVCEEMAGNLKDALNFYQKADRMLVKPDEDISSALLRIKKRIKEQEKLREQIEALPARSVVYVTGSMVNIRSGPGTQYHVIGKVNQGCQVTILEQSGGWYKVRLPDGKLGWIYKKLTSK